MPTQVGIHVFSLCWPQRRGWLAFAGHDEVASDASGNDSVVSPRALTAMSATVPANSSISTPFDVKKLGRINGIGHRITGDRTGQSNRRGIGWEFMHIAIGSAASSAVLLLTQPHLPTRPIPSHASLDRAGSSLAQRPPKAWA
jgi:hypothetical protein